MTNPKKILILTLLAFFAWGFPSRSKAAPGDTTFVQTFTFGSPQDAWFVFPPDTGRYERILMYYTLRCVAGNNPACGEWDYLTYTYLYQHSGTYDSNIVSVDTLLNDTTWNVFEVVTRFEIGRYITPYGIGLNLGTNGWTWVFDVTDYEPLLHDSVHLSAGNWQEELDMKFVMVEGAPPRDVVKIQNVWSGGHAYNPDIETDFLTPQSIVLDSATEMARLKIRNTGHGFGGTLNCSEFCPRNNTIVVNSADTLHQYLWRRNCDVNPLYPQGGTWVYDRANWCPGAEVGTDDYELTAWVTPGGNLQVDYDMEPGYVWDGQGSVPYYVIEGQLVEYGALNYVNEVSLEEIIAPSDKNLLRRYNPVCDNPVIVIRNNGSAPLTSLLIAYGPAGQMPVTFNWSGSLDFNETDTVYLPSFQNDVLFQFNEFEVNLTSPNGNNDEFSSNNFMRSHYLHTDVVDSTLILAILSNGAGQESWWELKDEAGNVIASVDSLVDNAYTEDTFHLAHGCYFWTMGDRDEDGINFFASPEDGNGWVKFFDGDGNIVKNINPNFGGRTMWAFYVDPVLEVEREKPSPVLQVFPNPANEMVTVSLVGKKMPDLQIQVLDAGGREVFPPLISDNGMGEWSLSVKDLPNGIYILRVGNNQMTATEKMVILK